jgi:hypothetical protein
MASARLGSYPDVCLGELKEAVKYFSLVPRHHPNCSDISSCVVRCVIVSYMPCRNILVCTVKYITFLQVTFRNYFVT